jgi:hypothetical protein
MGTNVSDYSCTENQNAHFTCNNFFSKYFAVFLDMRKNVVKPQKPEMPIQCGTEKCNLHAR